jgi:biotin-dependent carboxylase-like uncharacterized protein
MAAQLKILRVSPGATIQDNGRFLLRRFGVTPSGPMDWTAFKTVQRVLGNSNEAAAIEIAVGGIELTSMEATLDLAFVGGGFSWTRDGKPLPSAMRLNLRPGERLAARPGTWGAWAYLGIAGGFETATAMGSRATHLRSGIGPPMLQDGDCIPVALHEMQAARDLQIVADWLRPDAAPIRVLLGPQDDYFSSIARETFFSEPFSLTASADRMAYRFKGPKIEHAAGFNIVSDGIALGAIQIGGDGQPLILMADHQPTGGYPKLGFVIRADIGRLAQMRPGETCRFAACCMSEARAALFALEDKIAATATRTVAAGFSSEVLRSLNLIDGVVVTQNSGSLKSVRQDG